MGHWRLSQVNDAGIFYDDFFQTVHVFPKLSKLFFQLRKKNALSSWFGKSTIRKVNLSLRKRRRSRMRHPMDPFKSLTSDLWHYISIYIYIAICHAQRYSHGKKTCFWMFLKCVAWFSYRNFHGENEKWNCMTACVLFPRNHVFAEFNSFNVWYYVVEQENQWVYVTLCVVYEKIIELFGLDHFNVYYIYVCVYICMYIYICSLNTNMLCCLREN